MNVRTLSYSATVLSLLANVATAQQPVEGVHFERLNTPYGVGGDRIINVFSPACAHCYRFDDDLTTWADENNLQITRVPYFDDDRWAEVGRLVIAIQEAENNSEELIQELFRAIHEDNVATDDINAMITSLSFSGEKSNAIREVYSSNTVYRREEKIREWLQENRIIEIPAVVVDDQFFSDTARARGNDNLLLLLDYLKTIQ